MWIYTTAAVTTRIYGTSDTTSVAYNQGADWVGVCFAVYNGAAALFAFLIPVIAAKTSRKAVHAIALVAGGLGLASIFFISSPAMLLVSMLGVGFAWASILSMPYAMLAGALPPQKMGIYMGIFNFFIVIPQITAAGILGFIMKNLFGNQAIFALIIGGISMCIAAGLSMLVEDEH
jgi:maltose/moltooligosaccharide transporter